MRSIKFPKMFNTNNTCVWKASEYNEATKQNTKLLLHCERGELIGDPYFGLLLKHFMFDPNSYVTALFSDFEIHSDIEMIIDSNIEEIKPDDDLFDL